MTVKETFCFQYYLYLECPYTYGPPMAVAPLPSVRSVLDYALTEIPEEKIFLGIPNYGYDWALPYEKGVTRANSLGNVSAVRLAAATGSEILFDEYSQSPYFYYTDLQGIEHVVWFEDVRSIRGKFALTAENDLAGCGYWNIMRPFPQNYLMLNGTFVIEKVFGT